MEGEPPFAPSGYRSDRLFVVVRLRGGAPPAQPEQLEAITTAGHPVYEIELGDKYDLGAEFFRWEFATAVAASLLEVNPFDEPEDRRGQASHHPLARRLSPDGPASQSRPAWWIRLTQPS